MLSILTKPDETAAAATERFRETVADWFDREGRSYPWRKTRDPYAVLVSELMLQQTRIATVLERGYYERWMARFPDWAALAEAEENELLKFWEGLGYYNRARNLQRAARKVLERFGGRCPRDLDDILSLPGVGRYTAGAVASFAFGIDAPIVDGNVVRVLARLASYDGAVDASEGKRAIWALAESLTPSDRVRSYNSGIMELGQRVCRKSDPLCERCPISEFCRARLAGVVDAIPQKSARPKITRVVERVGLLVRNGTDSRDPARPSSRGPVFLTPETGGRRRGLWRLPEISEETAADLVEILRFPYAITRYRVDLRVFRVPDGTPFEGLLKEDSGGEWFDLADPGRWPPLGSPFRKAILKYLEISESELPGD